MFSFFYRYGQIPCWNSKGVWTKTILLKSSRINTTHRIWRQPIEGHVQTFQFLKVKVGLRIFRIVVEQDSFFNFLFKLYLLIFKLVYYLIYMLYCSMLGGSKNSDIENPIIQEDEFELIVTRSYIYGRLCTLVRLLIVLDECSSS